MTIIYLSQRERELLKGYFKSSPIGLIREKAQAIVMRDQGLQVKDVARVLFKSERTITRWLKDFSNRRMASIFSGLRSNENASKLTRSQKEEIGQVLIQKPSVYGLPKEFWDVPQLKKYIYVRFGTVYESDRSYHFLLEFGDLSFKYPDKFNVKRDEVKIDNRMEEIYGEIIPYLENSEWEVFCSDEVRMQLEAITRRAWIKKGEKTVLKVERSRDYQNYLGFLNQRTLKFLELYPNKKICIIWDNATCHKGILMRQALSKGGQLERVHLVALPPYAPDHNPIEHVWDTTKDTLSNNQDKTFEETKQKFMQQVNHKFFYYQI